MRTASPAVSFRNPYAELRMRGETERLMLVMGEINDAAAAAHAAKSLGGDLS